MNSWRYHRLRRLVEFNPQVPSKVREDLEGDYPLLPMEAINSFSAPDNPTLRPLRDLLTGYSYLEPSDVAYAKVTPCFENGKGIDGAELSGPTFATTEVTVLRPMAGMAQRFLAYLLQSRVFRDPAIASMTGAGGLKRVSETQMRDLKVACPSVNQQQRIAEFLDHETAEIDAFIADQRAFIHLASEHLDSSVYHKVINQLPSAERRMRGIFNQPDHPFGHSWFPLGSRALVDTGSCDTQDALPDGEYPFFVRSDTVENIDLYTHDTEAVLTAGDGAGVGKVFHHFNGKFAAHQRVYVIEPSKYVSGKFIYWILKFFFGRIVLAGTAKSTVESLRRPMLTQFPIPDLPLEKQKLLAEEFDALNAQHEMLLKDVEQAIELATERRSALISAAVTGQIDVSDRYAAEKVYEEVESVQ